MDISQAPQAPSNNGNNNGNSMSFNLTYMNLENDIIDNPKMVFTNSLGSLFDKYPDPKKLDLAFNILRLPRTEIKQTKFGYGYGINATYNGKSLFYFINTGELSMQQVEEMFDNLDNVFITLPINQTDFDKLLTAEFKTTD